LLGLLTEMNEHMEFNSYGVVKIAGAEPEVFWIVWANPKPPTPRGLFLRTSNNLSESELRIQLATMGLVEARIDELVQQARANPR
jgi:hypothetical protein